MNAMIDSDNGDDERSPYYTKLNAHERLEKCFECGDKHPAQDLHSGQPWYNSPLMSLCTDCVQQFAQADIDEFNFTSDHERLIESLRIVH